MEEEHFGDFGSDINFDAESCSITSMESMSDIVQSMATQIYAEFEKLITSYGDGVVEGLMPQLVGVLENWNKAIKEKQDIQLELDVTKEDNAQLLTEYEKEKHLRKLADQRAIEMDDVYEDQKKEMQNRIEDIMAKSKVFEVRAKNYQDQISRLEEKDSQLKSDYEKLHVRYTELFKNHMDVMERTKALMSSDRSDFENSYSDRVSQKISNKPSNSLAQSTMTADAPQVAGVEKIRKQNDTNSVTQNHINKDTSLSLQTEISNDKTDLSLALSLEAAAFDEFDTETDDHVTGMTKEVQNLIKENQELIQTKNALNVVKDDLIKDVDELTGTVELLKTELNTIRGQKDSLQEKVATLEEEVKKLNAKQLEAERKENEEDVPREQRKRFTRVEMARVLMERNQYKERLMELQEAVRWTEMIRASKESPDTKKKSAGLWSLFGGLASKADSATQKAKGYTTPEII